MIKPVGGGCCGRKVRRIGGSEEHAPLSGVFAPFQWSSVGSFNMTRAKRKEGRKASAWSQLIDEQSIFEWSSLN